MNPGPTGRSRRENFTMQETVIRKHRVPASNAGCPRTQIVRVSKDRAIPVPAAAVIPVVRVVAAFIWSKGSVAGPVSPLVNPRAQHAVFSGYFRTWDRER